MMTRRERLLATLRGEAVDRPAVNFYEVGGFAVDPTDPDPYNIYCDPSWRPLLELAEEETDLIRMCAPQTRPAAPAVTARFITTRQEERGTSRFTQTTVRVAGRTLTQMVRRDRDVDTNWVIEHLLKDSTDVEAYLSLPDEVLATEADVTNLIESERRLGDRGLVMVDLADPICLAAGLFSMEDFTLLAFTERELFHRLLAKLARPLSARTEAVARAFPGRLWRLYGPEYATAPFLPTALFVEYVVRYTGPLVRLIREQGGFVRLHCHGRIRDVLPYFVQMGATATDPIEPPPQGDITLREVREQYGRDLVLFGNLEITDIENLPPPRFEKVVRQAVEEGTAGEGRGFVLLPSAAPYGRTITPTTLANYRTMVRVVNER